MQQTYDMLGHRLKTSLRTRSLLALPLLVFLFAPAYASSYSPTPEALPNSAPTTISQVEGLEQAKISQDKGYDYYNIKTRLYFKRSQTKFEESYLTNAEQIKSITDFIDALGDAELVSANVFGAASPEGTLQGNTQLAMDRAARLKDFLFNLRPDVFGKDIDWKVTYEYEDWSQAIALMKQSDIKYREEAIDIMVNEPYNTIKDGKIVATRKGSLMALNQGKVWKEMDTKIFPYCRCADLYLVIRRLRPEVLQPIAIKPSLSKIGEPAAIDTVAVLEATRQPMLAVKTNLLLYGLWMEKYGWAPAPNIGVEFLPRTGHYTVGASLDIPWYRNYSNHKFFQVRNWQLEARRYFSGDAQYWGWYVQAYAHAAVWGVGFSKEEGWEGESFGGGIGGGYVLPISANKHWKLEFNLQLGYVRSKYDPYVYGHPTDGAEDGLYYYNWKLDPDLFQKRRYKHNWLGPTRVGITLSYDLLYYKRRTVK